MATYRGSDLQEQLQIEFNKILSEINEDLTYIDPNLSVMLSSKLFTSSDFTNQNYQLNTNKTL